MGTLFFIFITVIFFIPFWFSFTYFLLGLISVVAGVREQSSIKAKSGAKAIFYSLIVLTTIILIWLWVAQKFSISFPNLF